MVMGDKKKKIIKYCLILSCILLVVIATVVLQALNSSPVFAKSIISTSSTITRNSDDDNLYIYDYVKIFPSNYNQGLECKTSSENVEIENDGEIKFLQDEYFVTITVFAKSNQSELIHTSFDVVLSEYIAPTIEKDLIKIEETNIKNIYNNKLNCDKNSKISISSINNLVNYDYITGNMTVNENESHSCMYDKITIEILSQGVTTTLSFEVCIVKELTFNYNDEYCVIYFENTLTQNNEYLNFYIENENNLKIETYGGTYAMLAFLKKGRSEFEISCSAFKYFYNITIV